jgi:hypothetical protein
VEEKERGEEGRRRRRSRWGGRKLGGEKEWRKDEGEENSLREEEGIDSDGKDGCNNNIILLLL